MELKGKEYEHVDHPYVIGTIMELHETRADQMVTLAELVEKFYTIHLASSVHDERLNPISFRLMDDRSSAYAEKMWVAVFYGGFHVTIFRHQRTEGPHTAQLWFRSHTPPHDQWWVATLQVMAFFFNEDQVKQELMECIQRKEWYVSTNEGKKAIIP